MISLNFVRKSFSFKDWGVYYQRLALNIYNNKMIIYIFKEK